MSNFPKGNGSYTLVVPVTTENYANVETCLQWLGNGGVWPLSLLADLTDYKCEGDGMINGVSAQKWTYSLPIGPKTNKYEMWISWDEDVTNGEYIPRPVFFEVKGSDRYFIEFFNYKITVPDTSIWNDPQTMKCAPSAPNSLENDAPSNPIEAVLQHHERHMDFAWNHYLRTHGKVYNDHPEHVKRKATFKKNHRLVHAHNSGNHNYKLSLNRFADWTKEEMNALRGRVQPKESLATSTFPYQQTELLKMSETLPENLDWRLLGGVSPVKNQFNCGSCWSFSTTGAIEGAHFVKTGNLIRLSEQALMDCSWGFGNAGCNGGWEQAAYQWVMKHGGLPLEDDYPFRSFDGRCRCNETQLYANITGWVEIPPHDNNALKVALFKHGPAAIGINSDPQTFAFYSHGVYDDPACNPDDLDHGVLAVGYGVMNGQDYWLIKNSWSNWWGNDGYILISAKNNTCGVTNGATYVTM